MRMSTPARLALAATVAFATPAAAQQGTGDGFLFRAPSASVTLHGGLAQPLGRSNVFALATDELTLSRSDFLSGNFGGDLAFAIAPRTELVIGMDASRRKRASVYRDFVDNNDQEIRQTTTLQRTPLMANLRYYLRDRGRQVGSMAWIPARFVPFVMVGAGATAYRFEQVGDFVDQQTLDIFTERLTSKGWAFSMQAGAGGQWTLTPRTSITGELRYLHGTGDGDRPFGDFAGYKVDLSGVSTLIGLNFRL